MSVMNAGLPGNQNTAGAIYNYVQTGVYQSSATVPVPPGTKRIEALLCGGGGGGSGGVNGGGGGFGGCQIFDIPVAGLPLQLIVGAGGIAASPGGIGGTTAVSSAGTTYARVGGGGGGGHDLQNSGAGGSGIVIIRYADSYPAAASTTGSPTITVAGGHRVYKGTSSGSITF